MTDSISKQVEDKAPYPYWLNDFQKEMKGYEVWYREDWHRADGTTEQVDDIADGYRVFMIMCNNLCNETTSRMDVLNKLKEATEANPIKLSNEIFWCEKD